jgi:NADPH-dependent 2,4-dienoyl-CoA reductase/sulfur reductase-like enzyme
MSEPLTERFDVLVIGGGPAGMAASASATGNGQRVGIVDDNPELGGQIWRGELMNGSSPAVQWAGRVRAGGVRVLCGTRVLHEPQKGVLLAEGKHGLHRLGYRRLVLATGARERFLPFPGWTLPNVMGAGGLQALVKSGLPVSGKRVVVAGSGPLLLAVAAFLRQHGAEVPIICEQASWTVLARFSVSLLHHPGKIAQGLSLKRQLLGVPLATSSWVVSAEGNEKLEAVNVSRSGRVKRIPCDYLACGFHLVPNIELPALLGCQIHNGYVWVDDWQRTSVEHVFCAGEPTSIGGVELSLVEGEIAGLAAADRNKAAEALFAKRTKFKTFARALGQAFTPRAELRQLPQPKTIVCRCEDVDYQRLSQHTSWRTAKLQSRCGMGPCQGRVCGPATEFLLHWQPDSVRPPIFPARLESLAAAYSEPESQETKFTGVRA